MPIPANRVKDVCYAHVHTNAPGAAGQGYAHQVVQAFLKAPFPPTAKTVTSRGGPANQLFFAAALKKYGDERKLNYFDKTLFSVHIEEYTDGQGGRGQICIVLARQIAGVAAVKCACGRMVNPGPKARCPYCGRAVVVAAVAAGAAGGDDESLELMEPAPSTEPTVPAVPELDAAPAPPAMPGSDLGARMAARSRGAAAGGGGFVAENVKFLVGVGAVVAVVLVWALFFRGKGVSSAWRDYFEACNFEFGLPELEKALASAAVADRAELELRLAQGKYERAAMAAGSPANTGPVVDHEMAYCLSQNAVTLFVLFTIKNKTTSPIDVEPDQFYLLYRPPSSAWRIAFGERIEEAPFVRTTLAPNRQLRAGLYFALPPGAEISTTMYLVRNDGSRYRRTLVPTNFPTAPNKSFIDAEWKMRGPEPIPQADTAQNPPEQPAGGGETAITPSGPSGPPQPPRTSQPMMVGGALDLKGWRIELTGAQQYDNFYTTLVAGHEKVFMNLNFKVYADGDEAERWPLSSADIKLWRAEDGAVVEPLGGSLFSYKSRSGPRPIFSEFFQIKVGPPGFRAGNVIEEGGACVTDRFEELLERKKEGTIEMLYRTHYLEQVTAYRWYVKLGNVPTETPPNPAGKVIGSLWTSHAAASPADAIPMTDGVRYNTRIATEDWAITLVEARPGPLPEAIAKMGDRGMGVCCRLWIRPWPFRASSAAAPPLPMGGFAIRSPKGETYPVLGWMVKGELVDEVSILGSDTEGEATVTVKGKWAGLRLGKGGGAAVDVLLEAPKDEGPLEEYLLVHGLKTME